MPPRSSTVHRTRLASFQLALVVWALLVITRLFWLQVLDHAWLAHRALRQQEKFVPVEAQRGAIFDRHMTPLAMSLPVQSLFANQRQVHDPGEEAAALAPILHATEAELRQRLTGDRGFVWVARQLTAGQTERVRALQLAGLGFQPDTRRFYPKGELAASLLGYVGVDGHGLGGIEQSFDHGMAGQNGEAVLQVDAHRQSYSQLARAAVEGANVVLTLDQNIQFIAQQELDKRVAETHARRGIAVVENPRTGEILALATTPSFNPDDVQDSPRAALGDGAVSDPYEPGSVFKLVTLSAALQQGLITPDEMIDCQNGSIKVGGRIIHDHARFGLLSVTDILRHSSDVGAIKIGLKLGDQEFYHYIQAYGFGQRTGIRLPGESRGIVRPPQRWTPMSIGAVSMGQEVAVTPVQVVAMVSSLANGGVYHAPRVVLTSFTGAPPATQPRFEPDAGRTIVSPLVANEMKQMMAQVVLAGTAQQAQLNGYTAGGKTGTAQKVDPGTHTYSAHNYIASFAGFAPLNDPAITVLVVIDSPQGGHEGGATAGPVFKGIAERVLPYLGVPHDIPVQAARAPVRIAAVDAHEDSEQVADPTVVADTEPAPAAPAPTPDSPAAPAPPSASATGPLVVLDYGSHSVVAPDFTGQTVRAVSASCQRLGLVLSLQGNGVARAQSPAPGTRLASGTRVVVRFTP